MSSSFPPPSPRKQMQCVSAKNAAQAIPLEITEASILQMISFIHEQLTEQSISSAYFRLGIQNEYRQLSENLVRAKFCEVAHPNKVSNFVRFTQPLFILLAVASKKKAYPISEGWRGRNLHRAAAWPHIKANCCDKIAAMRGRGRLRHSLLATQV